MIPFNQNKILFFFEFSYTWTKKLPNASSYGKLHSYILLLNRVKKNIKKKLNK